MRLFLSVILFNYELQLAIDINILVECPELISSHLFILTIITNSPNIHIIKMMPELTNERLS
jgi:hypothetical protein